MTTASYPLSLQVATALVLSGAFVASTFAADTPTLQSTSTVKAPECFNIANIKGGESPVELYRAMRSCIDVERYDEAILAFGLAGVYGKYDAERVADVSSHQAVLILRRAALESSKPEQRQEFQRRAGDVYDNDAKRNQLCTEVASIGPPTYHPSYMLSHGLDAIAKPAKSGNGLVQTFDPAAAWSRAMSSYLQCK